MGRYATETNYGHIQALTAWAQARGHTLPELAIAWVMADPCVSTVLTGASTVAQVVANAASGDWALTPDEVAEVRALVEETNA
jgi:aryl-alcohol dehydrogenase-like predicted oxidoreductase